MTFYSSIQCQQCFNILDDSLHRPCIGKCNHPLCIACKNSQDFTNCPICDEPNAFSKTETVFDHLNIQMLADYKKNTLGQAFRKSLLELEDCATGLCSNCKSHSEKLRICTKCTKTIKPNGTGGWRPSEGNNPYLKVKNSAICADCVLNDHEGHEIILLASVDRLRDELKIGNRRAFASLCRLQRMKQSDAGKFTSEWTPMIAKMLVEQWDNIKKKETRYQSYNKRKEEFIKQMNEFPDLPIFLNWKSELNNSLSEIKKLQKILLNLEKMEIMNKKALILEQWFLLPQTERKCEVEKDVLETIKLLPVHLLSEGEYLYSDQMITARVGNVIEKIAKKHPDRRNDIDYLNLEAIKVLSERTNILLDETNQQEEKLSEDSKNLESDKKLCINQLVNASHEEKFRRQLEYLSEVVRIQLKEDEIHLQQLKTLENEIYIREILNRGHHEKDYFPEISKILAKDFSKGI